ncbi:MAG TPA: ATP-binding protein, partial [Actinomycetota bacterium]|nr:ATP-binding protein [Actinomycetota bacterium]
MNRDRSTPGGRPLPAAIPFVGRGRELEALGDAVEQAFQGRGSICLLAGEPGIGKSRLADEVAGRARERGGVVLWGRCWEAGGAPAYWPWVQSLRSLVRTIGVETAIGHLGDDADELAQLLPEIRELRPVALESPTGDPDAARFRLFDSLTRFLLGAASDRPLVVVLDDLHAADVPSLLLLRFQAAQMRDAALMLVGTYRDVA